MLLQLQKLQLELKLLLLLQPLNLLLRLLHLPLRFLAHLFKVLLLNLLFVRLQTNFLLLGFWGLMLLRFSLLLLKEVAQEQRFVPRPLKKMQKNSVLNCLRGMREMLHKSYQLQKII